MDKNRFMNGGNTNTNMDTDQNKKINKNKDQIDNSSDNSI